MGSRHQPHAGVGRAAAPGLGAFGMGRLPRAFRLLWPCQACLGQSSTDPLEHLGQLQRKALRPAVRSRSGGRFRRKSPGHRRWLGILQWQRAPGSRALPGIRGRSSLHAREGAVAGLLADRRLGSRPEWGWAETGSPAARQRRPAAARNLEHGGGFHRVVEILLGPEFVRGARFPAAPKHSDHARVRSAGAQAGLRVRAPWPGCLGAARSGPSGASVSPSN